MATLKEIAEKAGVSIGTVDRALHNRGRVNAETAKKVKKIAEELDYTPNQLGVALYKKKRKLNIGFMVPDEKNIISGFYEEIKAGALEEMKELREYAITVEFFQINFDFTKGIDIYPELTEKEWDRLDGLVTLGGNTDELNHILELADKKEIPVVLYNMSSHSDKVLTTVQCDYVQAGRIAAGLARIMIMGPGKIGILSSDSITVPSYVKRLEGFQKELQQENSELAISFVKSFPGDMEESKAVAFLNDILRDYVDVDILYVINPGDCRIFGAVHKVEKLKNVRIITNDLSGEQKKLLQEKIIAATITQDPFSQGELPLKILKDFLIFGKKPNTKTVFTKLEIHLSQNI